MKFHRHTLYFGRDGMEKPNADFKRESGYMYCDLCKCKPTSSAAGDPPTDISILVDTVKAIREELRSGIKPDDVE